MIELLLLLAIVGFMHAVASFASGAAAGGTELAFGYLLLAAYLAARVIGRFRLPRLTGYILAGLLSGPFVFGLVNSSMTASLKIVNDTALCILGLTAGGEMNLARVKPLMKTLRAITAFGVIAAMLVLSAVVFLLHPFLSVFDGLAFGQALALCGLIGIALSAQSPAVVLALLSETRADGPLSRLVLATVVVADLVVLIAYSVVAAMASAVIGHNLDLIVTALAVGWQVIGSVVFGVVVGIVIARFVRYVEKGAPLFTLLVCLVVAEIGSRVQLEPVIIMLAAGVWLENFARVDASKLLRSFRDSVLPVLLVVFALAGSRLDLRELAAIAIPVAALVIARGMVFYVGSRAACARTEGGPVLAKYAWTGLVPQAGLSVALVSVMSKNFPKLGPRAAILVLGVVGVNQLIAPVLLRISLVRSREVGQREATAPAPAPAAPAAARAMHGSTS